MEAKSLIYCAIYKAEADFKPVLHVELSHWLATYKNARSWELPWGEYPDGVMEPEMIENFHRQASMMGVDLRIVYVNTMDFSQPPYVSELKLI